MRFVVAGSSCRRRTYGAAPCISDLCSVRHNCQRQYGRDCYGRAYSLDWSSRATPGSAASANFAFTGVGERGICCFFRLSEDGEKNPRPSRKTRCCFAPSSSPSSGAESTAFLPEMPSSPARIPGYSFLSHCMARPPFLSPSAQDVGGISVRNVGVLPRIGKTVFPAKARVQT